MSQVIDTPLWALGAADSAPRPTVRGRDTEQGLLARRIRRLVHHGDGGVLWVGGPAGIGRSRLLDDAAAEAHLGGARVLTGSGACRDAITPMAPLLDALTRDGAGGFTRGLRERAIGQGDSYWLVREAKDRLRCLTADGPVVLAVDDVHDCDPLTLLAVRTLTAQLAGRPLLWVLTARSHTDAPAVEALRRDLLAGNATHLEPAPLAPQAVRQMVGDLLGIRAPAAEPYVRCLDGLPGAIRHACAHLAEHGTDSPSNGPDTERRVVGAVVARRLDQLTEEARELTLTASVLGSTFTVRHLAQALGRRESALLRPLREVLGARLLESRADRLSFRHQPVREAVACTLPRPLRLAMGGRSVGLWLKASVPAAAATRPAEVAGPVGLRAVEVLSEAAEEPAPLAPGRAEPAAAEVPTAPGRSAASEADLLCTTVRLAFHTGDDTALEACAAKGEEYLAGDDPQRRRVGAWVAVVCAVYREVPLTDRQLRHAADHLRRGFPHTACADPGDTVFFVRAALASGLRDIAASAVEYAEDGARRNARLPVFRATAEHARGLLEGSAERLVEAAERYAPRWPLLAARAQEDAATVLAESGSPGARSRFEQALELYTGCGADRDARRVRGRLREFGITSSAVGGGSEAGWRGLTPSELGVVRLIARGATNRQAAERLFLSPHTVNSHVRHAFDKLGVRSRVQLARLYMREVDRLADASEWSAP